MSDEFASGGGARPGRAIAAPRKLRILSIVDCLMTSGGEIFATQVAMGLDRERFESTICSTRTSADDVVRMVEAAGVRTVVLARRSRLDVWKWLPLVDLITRERIDVIHAHKFGSSVWAVPLAAITRVPVLVAHEHSRSYDGQVLRRFLDREWIGRAADVFLSTSRADRAAMVEVERVDANKARFLANGVLAPRAGDGAGIRVELGLTADDLVVGTVCALRPEKALEVFLEAVAIVAPGRPNLRAVIVGGGPERGRLESEASRLGLSSVVVFAGAQPHDRVADFLAAFDVAVSSSDFEGGPLAVLEYMAAGRAIVATSVGGVPDLITHGLHGLLFAPRDPAGAAAAIEALVDDAGLRAELGANARARQASEFDLGRTVRRLETLYESLYWASRRGWQDSVHESRLLAG